MGLVGTLRAGRLWKEPTDEHIFYLPKKPHFGVNINYKTRLTRTKPITPSELPFCLRLHGMGGRRMRTVRRGQERASFLRNSVPKT